MSFFELFGLLIVIIALLAPVIRRILARRAQRKNPEEFARRKAAAEEREKEALRQLLTQMGQEIPPELREKEPEPEVRLVSRPLVWPEEEPVREIKPITEPVADESYALQHAVSSPIQKLIKRSSGREMVLLREILEPPVSLR